MGIKLLILAIFLAKSCLADDFFDPVKHLILWLRCYPSDVYTKAHDLNETWFNQHEANGWYYVMGNKHHAVILAKSLTGKEPERSLKGACFTNQRIENGFQITGYNNSIARYTCSTVMFGKRECKPTTGSTNEIWAANRGTTEATIVWTDNKNYVLSYRCSGMYRVWALRSTENVDVTKEMRDKIIKVIKTDGFNRKNLLEYPRTGCPSILT